MHRTLWKLNWFALFPQTHRFATCGFMTLSGPFPALNLSTNPPLFQRPQNLLPVTLIAHALAFVPVSHQSSLSIHPAPQRPQICPAGDPEAQDGNPSGPGKRLNGPLLGAMQYSQNLQPPLLLPVHDNEWGVWDDQLTGPLLAASAAHGWKSSQTGEGEIDLRILCLRHMGFFPCRKLKVRETISLGTR